MGWGEGRVQLRWVQSGVPVGACVFGLWLCGPGGHRLSPFVACSDVSGLATQRLGGVLNAVAK